MELNMWKNYFLNYKYHGDKNCLSKVHIRDRPVLCKNLIFVRKRARTEATD